MNAQARQWMKSNRELSAPPFPARSSVIGWRGVPAHADQ
ncbi:hypothetical protein RISK_001650 [Rhodopirellula islandica]|uniref:Uncharacterized protein n=1 Tax=Rhodopirellula islandica TaxID=595434 RepID=A0A0J1ELP7_RHOIS|nr:hypothetical protein RISK_001650 [Rhodopirellula islandica]